MASFATLKSIVVISCLVQISSINGHRNDDQPQGIAVDLHSKDLILVKIWCLLILLVISLAGGVVPYFFRGNESFLLLGTQFAGGIFLGTSLMHFLSESNYIFGDLISSEYFGFMLASVGYLLPALGNCIVKGRKKEATVEVEQGRGEQRPNEHVNTILLILALSSHSVFEGLNIAISVRKRYAWRSLWTTALYQIFVALAMGIALIRMISKCQFWGIVAYSFAFAIWSPIGVGIGIALDKTTLRDADWVYASSMAIASGILISVATNNLISKGFKPQAECYFDTLFFKFLALLLGVGVIAVVLLFG